MLFLLFPTVVGLLFSGRPAAVARLIISIVFFAVQGFAYRPQSHIGEEVFKRRPSFAHLDAAPTVVFVLPVLRITAARQHRSVTAIGRRSVHAVSRLLFTHLVGPDAPAGCCHAIAKRLRADRFFDAALTPAKERRGAPDILGAREYSQLPELLPLQIFQIHVPSSIVIATRTPTGTPFL